MNLYRVMLDHSPNDTAALADDVWVLFNRVFFFKEETLNTNTTKVVLSVQKNKMQLIWTPFKEVSENTQMKNTDE